MMGVYLCGYITSKYITTWKENPDSVPKLINFIPDDDTRNYVIFLAFWFGTFRSEDDSLRNLNDNTNIIILFWPFYVMFISLIIERFCQFWLMDRFGCTDIEMNESPQLREFDHIIEIFNKINAPLHKE